MKEHDGTGDDADKEVSDGKEAAVLEDDEEE